MREDAGEAQFTETGVSGPAAFTLSRQAGQAQAAELLLDLLRAYPEPQVLALLAARKAALPQLAAEDALAGMLHPRLGKTLCRACGLRQQPLAGVPDEALAALAKKIKNFALPVTGVSGFERTGDGGRRPDRGVPCRHAGEPARAGRVRMRRGDWISTATAAGTTCSGRGRPAMWPVCLENRRKPDDPHP
ncbi:MAG: hypothetical protein ACLU3F_15490 [Blautia wexlerae]